MSRGCWVVGPPTRVPYRLQLLLLQVLQALAAAQLLSEMEADRCDPAGEIHRVQERQVVQRAEVPQAPPAVRRCFYSTVIVGAKW